MNFQKKKTQVIGNVFFTVPMPLGYENRKVERTPRDPQK